jgi:hypothetical protein
MVLYSLDGVKNSDHQGNPEGYVMFKLLLFESCEQRWFSQVGRSRQVLDMDRNFSLCHRIQNGSGPYPASYPMGTGTGGSFPGGNVAGA